MVSYWRKQGIRTKPVGKVDHQASSISSSSSGSTYPNKRAESPLVILGIIRWYNLSFIANPLERKGQTKTNKMSDPPPMQSYPPEYLVTTIMQGIPSEIQQNWSMQDLDSNTTFPHNLFNLEGNPMIPIPLMWTRGACSTDWGVAVKVIHHQSRQAKLSNHIWKVFFLS